MLQNRIYRGEIVHKGEAYPGEHDAIINVELWNSVARRLAANRRERELGVGADEPSLLAGLVRDSTGERMTPTHAVKGRKRYRYYVSQSLVAAGRRPAAAGRRIPAGDIEALVLDRLRQFFASSSEVSDVLSRFDLDAPRELAAHPSGLAESWLERRAGDNRTHALSLIHAVVIHDLHIELHLKRSGVVSTLQLTCAKALMSKLAVSKEDLFELRIDARLKRTGRGVRLIGGDGTTSLPDEGLVGLMARAFDAREQLLSGRYSSIDDMARQTNASGTYLTTLVRLTYLAPDIIHAILDGRQPVDLSLTRLMTSTKGLPHGWADQRCYLHFPSA
jgi:site-specific DNA recombinase